MSPAQQNTIEKIIRRGHIQRIRQHILHQPGNMLDFNAAACYAATLFRQGYRMETGEPRPEKIAADSNPQ